jgi:hypothetical protein
MTDVINATIKYLISNYFETFLITAKYSNICHKHLGPIRHSLIGRRLTPPPHFQLLLFDEVDVLLRHYRIRFYQYVYDNIATQLINILFQLCCKSGIAAKLWQPTLRFYWFDCHGLSFRTIITTFHLTPHSLNFDSFSLTKTFQDFKQTF